jgi:protein-disulfide isomerase
MHLTSETKLFIGVIIGTIVLIIGAIVIFSRPVKPLEKADLIPTTAPVKGNQNAPHFLVEFSDFQCPACKAFSSSVKTLSTKYPDKLLIAYRYFPLPQHAYAKKSAYAAESAHAQGKFWEIEELLFENQESLSDELVASLAAQLKLDIPAFQKSLTNQKVIDLVQSDLDYGNRIGIDATPTFYLDGIKLSLLDPQDLISQVENALK